jgi:hypothetical protein
MGRGDIGYIDVIARSVLILSKHRIYSFGEFRFALAADIAGVDLDERYLIHRSLLLVEIDLVVASLLMSVTSLKILN